MNQAISPGPPAFRRFGRRGPFQRRVVPWALVKAAVKGDVDEELGVQCRPQLVA